jgi:hypothetical protein
MLGDARHLQQRRAHGTGFQQAADCASPTSASSGRSLRQRGRTRGQRLAKLQPVPRRPGGGTVPAMVGSLPPLGTSRGRAASRPCV